MSNEDILLSRQSAWPNIPEDNESISVPWNKQKILLQVQQARTFDTIVNIYSQLPSIVSVATNYTVDAATVILVDASAAARTITLPTAVKKTDRVYWVKKVDTDTGNAVTVDGSGSETIDTAANVAITASYGCVSLISDGTSWHSLIKNT